MLQDSNLRPLPRESGQGDRQTYTNLSKPSQPREIDKSRGSDFRLALAPFFPRVGPNWVQCLSSKYQTRTEPIAALLSVRQVSHFLDVSTAIVYRLCERGELAHSRVSHTIRVGLDDLAAYLERQRARP